MTTYLRITGIALNALGALLLAWRVKGILDTLVLAQHANDITFRLLKDILNNGINGLVVSPGDSQQLYDALNKLIVDRALFATLGQAARKTVQERYSLDTVNRDYMALFNNVYKQRYF